MQEYLQRHEEKLLKNEAGLRGHTGSVVNPWAKDDRQATTSSSTSQLYRQLTTSGGGTTVSAPLLKPAPNGGGQILLFLLRLRQCCSHLSLMKDVSHAVQI